jgi:hypothetical protein
MDGLEVFVGAPTLVGLPFVGHPNDRPPSGDRGRGGGHRRDDLQAEADPVARVDVATHGALGGKRTCYSDHWPVS